MKEDFQEVVKERSRYRHSDHRPTKGRYKRNAGHDVEDMPLSESLSNLQAHGYSRSPNTHSAPLRRWLNKQVGRPWNDVYAEVAAVAKFTPNVHNLRKMLRWFVAFEVVFVNKVPIDTRRTWCTNVSLYIHPETFKLELYVAPRKDDPKPPVDFILITELESGWNKTLFNAGRICYRKLDGIWYLVKEWYDKGRRAGWYSLDAFSRQTVTKRQLNTKELRSLGLDNNPNIFRPREDLEIRNQKLRFLSGS